MSSPHDFSRRRKKGFRTLERVAEEGRGGAAPLFLPDFLGLKHTLSY